MVFTIIHSIGIEKLYKWQLLRYKKPTLLRNLYGVTVWPLPLKTTVKTLVLLALKIIRVFMINLFLIELEFTEMWAGSKMKTFLLARVHQEKLSLICSLMMVLL